MDTLVNKVANSSLLTINLEEYFPVEEMINFDLKDYLFQGLILKEKDFRQVLKEMEWDTMKDKVLLVYCSTDAIIPVWAFMLVAAYAEPHAHQVFQGNKAQYLTQYYHKVISELDVTSYDQKRVVIKGCSDKPVPPSAYADITSKLQPIVQSLMYGETLFHSSDLQKTEKTLGAISGAYFSL